MINKTRRSTEITKTFKVYTAMFWYDPSHYPIIEKIPNTE